MAPQDVAMGPADCRPGHTLSSAKTEDTMHASHATQDSVTAESEGKSSADNVQGESDTKEVGSKVNNASGKRRRRSSKVPRPAGPAVDSELCFSDDEAANSGGSEKDASDFRSDNCERPSKPKSKPSSNMSQTNVKSRKDKKRKPAIPAPPKKSPTRKKQAKRDIDSEEDEETGDSIDDDSESELDVNEEMASLRLQLAQAQQRLAAFNTPHSTVDSAPLTGADFQCCSVSPGDTPNIGCGNRASMNHACSLYQQQSMALLPPPPPHPAPRFLVPFAPSMYHGPLQAGIIPLRTDGPAAQQNSTEHSKSPPKDNAQQETKEATGLEYRRVNSVWDSAMFAYKLEDTAPVETDSKDSEYIFHVRRTFNHEGKYRKTFVDINSKLLRECLKDVIGDVKGVSLVEETPEMEPNLLFLYVDEFRAHLKHLGQALPTGETRRERKKAHRRLDDKRKQLKALIRYIDKDYAKVRDSLYPLIKHGLITFDLLWALWKPNTLAYTTTYGSSDEPRVFKVSQAERISDMMKGRFYGISGKSFEFDGKKFGYGSFVEEIPEFQGARKITTLPCYPLQHHRGEAQLRRDLIERGKKFVSLAGVHHMAYSGMAYAKGKKNGIIKFDIQHSRIMIDATIFRRINPNYHFSTVRPKDYDATSEGGYSSDDQSADTGGGNSSDEAFGNGEGVQFVRKIFTAANGDMHINEVPKDASDSNRDKEQLEAIPERDTDDVDVNVDVEADGVASMARRGSADGDGKSKSKRLAEFTDMEYLMASPVVVGFSFSDKDWFEFTVSGIKDIEWNEAAWDSLVLEPATKDLIQALVKSRKYNATQKIDDVIQGKGKGLVTVLHGPPGTGKTLTAEGISELLRCPLYMASAGELSINARYLEAELQRILDICHSWGAILLLDEADVFLEQRNMRDVQRNSLVSIFLRQLEYFQGTLFLTTNRVETFDEAFQSRIHIALRYETLNAKAKKTIFKMFIERVRALGKIELGPFTEADLTALAKNDLNGREIKNVISSAQDLAISKGEALGMSHAKRVMEVHAKFGRDLRGGTGYEDAMRSYF